MDGTALLAARDLRRIARFKDVLQHARTNVLLVPNGNVTGALAVTNEGLNWAPARYGRRLRIPQIPISWEVISEVRLLPIGGLKDCAKVGVALADGAIVFLTVTRYTEFARALKQRRGLHVEIR